MGERGYTVDGGRQDVEVSDYKVARAPWQSGTMFPCEWAEGGGQDPRRPFQKAQMVAELPIERIHQAWPFPDDELPDWVKPAVLLPHDPPDPPLLFVDVDDVRDPSSGEVTIEVVELLEELGAYVELSRSGRGLHAYVRAELPAGMKQFQAPLADAGSIELYDHSRFTGGTWRHVEGTPRDRVPRAQGAIESIVRRYGGS